MQTLRTPHTACAETLSSDSEHPSPRTRWTGAWRWGLLSVIVLGAFLLRVHNLSRTFVWQDETDMFNEYVYGSNHKSLIDFALYTRDETTVTWGWPGLLWIVCRAFGPTATTARMLTVLFSTAGVLLVYSLAQSLLNRDRIQAAYWPAIFAALFAAVSVLQLEYAQRTYPYGAAPCLSAALLLAYFNIRRAASAGWKYSPQLARAIVLYTVIASIGMCIHASLALLPAISAAFLCGSAVRDLRWQSWPERWKLLRLALAAGAMLGCAALLNAKNPKYGFRPYLTDYYSTPSLRSIPKLLRHAYDLLTYHVNVFYNPALYWPERLNALLLPLVLLCLLGWGLAMSGKFGPQASHFALLGLTAFAMPAALSVIRVFPFGGVRQTLFLAPFLLIFTALGLYVLRARPITRVAGVAIACGYLVVWALNLPAFYGHRQTVYTPGNIVKVWEQNGRLPFYSRGNERELRYALRDHPEMSFGHLPIQHHLYTWTQAPPYLVIGTHSWIGDDLWFRDFPGYLQQRGYKAELLAQFPSWNTASIQAPQCLYFPPNGLWIYKITAQ